MTCSNETWTKSENLLVVDYINAEITEILKMLKNNISHLL